MILTLQRPGRSQPASQGSRLAVAGRRVLRFGAFLLLLTLAPAQASEVAARVLQALSGPHVEGTSPRPTAPGAPMVLALAPSLEVGGAGIYLDQLLKVPTNTAIPRARVAAAPSVNQPATLGRAQVAEWLRTYAPEVTATNWSGPDRVIVRRKSRMLDETELRSMLSEALQRDFVKDRGELEVRLLRPWISTPVPDEPLLLRIVDLPGTGVGPSFLARIELLSDDERVGGWQISVAAKVWREIPVAQSALRRGQRLSEAQVSVERRDVLPLRDPVWTQPLDDPSLELAEGVPAGQPIFARCIRQRAVVQRGQIAEGLVRDGAFSISLKVEVLSDGVPGQTIRVRNPRTRRELLAKVLNDETVLIAP